MTTKAVELEWDANEEPDVAGYRIYAGTESGQYTTVIDTGNETHATLPVLQPGATHYFAVTAYTASNLESPFSEEISHTAPVDGRNAVVTQSEVAKLEGEGVMRIRFQIKAGQRCAILASHDLQSWRLLFASDCTRDADTAYDDLDAVYYPMRFYRVVISPP